jgi:staphylococcal nuclease domain-containing protein 1
MPSGTVTESEPFGDEAMSFVKELIMQREVDIEVETMDKGGNFIGWLFCENTNISLSLVEEGFANAFVGSTGDKSNYGRAILQVSFFLVDQ